jgi:predicted nucleotidyltransferase
MTPILLDFSQRPELGQHARVIADVEAAAAPMGVAPLIVGAFARDLHLQYPHGITMQRQTQDIDFALAVSDWATFERLRAKSIGGEWFTAYENSVHRLRHHTGLPVDLVPFGGIELADRTIVWPPQGASVMDVFGFREGLANAVPVLFPGGIRSRTVTLAALAVLKIVCWQDRHYEAPRKDAHDLQMILRHYLAAGNEPRLWSEFIEWTQHDDFDYERAGPRMLGRDIAQLLNPDGLAPVARIIWDQTHPDSSGRLPTEMNPADPDLAIAWLDAPVHAMHEKPAQR